MYVQTDLIALYVDLFKQLLQKKSKNDSSVIFLQYSRKKKKVQNSNKILLKNKCYRVKYF